MTESEILGADGKPALKEGPPIRGRHCSWRIDGCRGKVECRCECRDCLAASVADGLQKAKRDERETVMRAIKTDARVSNAAARMLARTELEGLGLTRPRPK